MLDDEYEALDESLIGGATTAPLDETRANGVLREIARRRRAYADAEMVASAEVVRVTEWLDARRAALATADLEATLADYHRARLVDDPKVLTIDLPNGTLTSRQGQPTWVFDDETFIEWAARTRPHLLVETIRTTVAKNEAKKALTIKDDVAVDPDSGEVVPGVTVTPAVRTFTVKTRDGGSF